MNVAMDLIRTSAAMRSTSPSFDPYDIRSFPDNFVSAFPFPSPGLSAHSSLPDFQPVLCVSFRTSAAQGAPETLEPNHVVSTPAVRVAFPALESSLENLQRSKSDAFTFILQEVKRENGDEEDHCYTASGKIDEWSVGELGEWSLSGVEERLRELEDDFQVAASMTPAYTEVCEETFGNEHPARPVEERSVHLPEEVSISESEGLQQRCLLSPHSILDIDADVQAVNEALLERFQLERKCNYSVETSRCHVNHARTEIADRDFKASVDNIKLNLLHREHPFEMQLHELIRACPTRKRSALTFSKSMHEKKDAIGTATHWLRKRKAMGGLCCRLRCTGCELGRQRKNHAAHTKSWMHHKSHFRSSSELEIQPVIRKKSKVDTVLRSTNVILALPASFSEQDRSHLGKQYNQVFKFISKTKLSQGCQCPVGGGQSIGRKVAFKEDSQQQSEISHSTNEKGRFGSKQAKLALEDCNDYDQPYNGRVRFNLRLGRGHSQPLERYLKNRLHRRKTFVEQEIMRNCAAVEQQQATGKQWHCFQQPKQGFFVRSGCFSESNGHLNHGREYQVERCHRNDGKGWQCPQEAKLGSVFCEHHLKSRRNLHSKRNLRAQQADFLHEQLPLCPKTNTL